MSDRNFDPGYCPKCDLWENRSEHTICPSCGKGLFGKSEEAIAQPLPPPKKEIPTPPPSLEKKEPNPPPVKVERYPGFWIRLVATIVDAVVVQILILPVFFVLWIDPMSGDFYRELEGIATDYVVVGFKGYLMLPPLFVLGLRILPRPWIPLYPPTTRIAEMQFVVLVFIAYLIYEAVMESSPRQATLGKMAFGLTVTDVNGNRISFARATGRHFAKYISSLIFLVGYIIAGFTARKQALHDMIAGTLVQRTELSSHASAAYPVFTLISKIRSYSQRMRKA